MPVEFLVVLILKLAWLLNPQWLYIIYNIVLFGIHLLAVLPFGFLAESNRYGQKVAVFAQQFLYLVLFQEFLAVIVNVHNDAGTTIGFVCFLQCERRAAVAAPLHGWGILIALCDNIDLLADHERTVETESEVPDDGIGIVLVFVKEVIGP